MRRKKGSTKEKALPNTNTQRSTSPPARQSNLHPYNHPPKYLPSQPPLDKKNHPTVHTDLST
ncbi:hypothetical protein B9Z19DRAFT_1084800, partial [Tuber borchii]